MRFVRLVRLVSLLLHTYIGSEIQRYRNFFKKYVAEIEFPTVTICGSGHYLSLVEREVYSKFVEWNKQRNSSTEQTEHEQVAAFRQFLLEVYRVENGTSLMDILSTMLSPKTEAAEAKWLVRHQQFCAASTEEGGGRRKRQAQANHNGNTYPLQPS